MKDARKIQPIQLGSARRVTKTDWTGDLPELDTPIMFRKVA